jgi:membrane fusion protein, multidrug efflux system
MPDGFHLPAAETEHSDSETFASTKQRARKITTRQKAFAALGAVIAVSALGAGANWMLVASRYVSTENAYVGASVSQLSAQVQGTIAAVPVHSSQAVHRGDILAAIDPIDAQLDLERARAAFEQAQADYMRRRDLASTGAISREELTATRSAYDAARANLDTARLAVERTTIRAPIDGIVAQVQAQVGQRVQPGVPLMAVVPVQDAYVDANFKESELHNVHIGQSAELHADIYGHDVTYHGRVEGIGAGSGSAFAAIPAQNATGNWIKVVQRVPVRIALDRAELAAHPLRVGLSMHATIDVSEH